MRVVVSNPDDETGPAMICPEGTNVTAEHARQAATTFWAMLVGDPSG
jgi:hypothetical protein